MAGLAATRWLAATAVLAGACACLAAAGPPGPGSNGVDTMRELAAAADSNDCKTVLSRGRPLIDVRRGSGLAPEAEAYVLELVAWCESREGAKAQALAHAIRGTALEQSSDYLWRLRLSLQWETRNYDAAVATVEAMSQGRGAALNGAAQSVGTLYTRLRSADREDLRRRLLKVLATDFAPEEYYGPPDYYRSEYAALLAADGRTDAARTLVLALEDPRVIIRASLDRRLRALFVKEPDVRAAAEALLERHREAMARWPDRLGPINNAAQDLRLLGRPQEAIELLKSAAPRIARPDGFEDRERQLSWWWNGLSASYDALGRYDEAAAALRSGAALAEGGQLNVSQVINLADLQLYNAHPAEAVQTLATFDATKHDVSPYGWMQIHFNRGCALVAEGRREAAAADIAYAQAHEKDDPSAASDILLCAGNMDGAAAAFVRRLDDPDLSAEALIELSDYDEPAVANPNDPVLPHLPALRARPEVQAAIVRAGGVRRFKVQRYES